MSNRTNRMRKQKFDPEKPHDGWTLDFVNRIFIRKPQGQTANYYNNFENIFTFSRASAALFVNSQGILESVASGIPRYDYNPANLHPRGILMEQSESQICRETQTFDSATWTKTNVTISADAATAPDNTSTADQLIEDLVGPLAFNLTQSMSTSSGSPYTFSVWAKANTRNWIYLEMPASAFTSAVRVYFDVLNGTIGTSSGSPSRTSIEAYPNGWYRIEVTKTATTTAAGNFLIGLADADNSPTYVGDGTSNLYIWGAQYEQQVESSSYMATTSGAASRQPDVAILSSLLKNGDINPSQGTSYIEFMIRATPTVAESFVTVSGSARIPGLTNLVTTMNVFDGTNTVTIGSVSFTHGVFYKAICSWGPGVGANELKIFQQHDGGIATATGTFTPPLGTVANPVTMAIATNTAGGASSSIVRIRKIDVWPYKLSDAEMLAIISKSSLT